MSNDLDLLTASLQNYVVSPLNAFGLGGFVFDLEGESKTDLESEITDHYTEDNKATQDHIARRPKVITLKGYVGELVYSGNQPNGATPLQNVVQKLTEVAGFLPTVSAATTQVQNLFSSTTAGFSDSVSDAANLYGLVQNVLGATGDMAKQQNAYSYFASLWSQGILLGVQTPWEFLTNMAVIRVTAIQDERTKYMTDFSITLKQMRFAQTSSAAYNSDGLGGVPGAPIIPVDTVQLDGVAAIQALDPVKIGNVNGVSLPTDTLPGQQSLMMNASDLYTKTGKVFNPTPPPATAF